MQSQIVARFDMRPENPDDIVVTLRSLAEKVFGTKNMVVEMRSGSFEIVLLVVGAIGAIGTIAGAAKAIAELVKYLRPADHPRPSLAVTVKLNGGSLITSNEPILDLDAAARELITQTVEVFVEDLYPRGGISLTVIAGLSPAGPFAGIKHIREETGGFSTIIEYLETTDEHRRFLS